MADTTVERGEMGFPLVKGVEPGTVAHTVDKPVTLTELAEELGLDIEALWQHNRDLMGWSVHPRTGERKHVVPVTPGTIVHLPAGTELATDAPDTGGTAADDPDAEPPRRSGGKGASA